MLSSYRVIDCTDERGQLAGLVLAQLGADVVLVEPPGGSSARWCPPFAGDRRDADSSLWHWAYNRGKRSVIADLTTPAGRARLDDLVADGDVLLWTGTPSEMPFSYEHLAVVNPGLVVVVLSPFGLDGPKANWAGTDLIVSAAGCGVALVGDADRPPLRWGSPQAFLHGAADMAVAALVALAERRRSGRGQLVDVSAQASCLQSSFCYSLNDAWNWPLMRRSGDGIDFGRFKLRWTYPAADGDVSITFSFGEALAHFTENLFRWIWEEGGCDEATRDTPWIELSQGLFSGTVSPSEADRLCRGHRPIHRHPHARRTSPRRRHVGACCSRRSATLTEVMQNDHLAAAPLLGRGAASEADRTHRHPGRFVLAPAAPLRALGPAPRLGHIDDIAPVRAGRGRRTSVRADAGAGAALAGADGARSDLVGRRSATSVGRSPTSVPPWCASRPDRVRTWPAPRRHSIPSASRSRSRAAACTPTATPASSASSWTFPTPLRREVFWDLVRWADVLVESFSAGALARMGFGYEHAARRQPAPGRVVELPAGPDRLAGDARSRQPHHRAVRLHEHDPLAGPKPGVGRSAPTPTWYLPASDSPRCWRHWSTAERTGEGQYLDLSQAECSMHLQATALLDAEVNRRPFAARGNRDLVMAPHGVYPAGATDTWVAIACATDVHWRSLAGWLDRPDLAGLSVTERHDRHDELDDVIARRTAVERRRRAPERVARPRHPGSPGTEQPGMPG